MRRTIALVLTVFLVLHVAGAVRVAWVVHHNVSSTSFMRKDVEDAQAGKYPRAISTEVAHPAQEWVSLNNMSRDALSLDAGQQGQRSVW